MKKISFRFGLYAFIVITLLIVISFVSFKGKHNWGLEEIIGYASILVSLIFVFFGIKQWRDQCNQGKLSFTEGLKLGALISLFPSFAFGLFSWIEMSILEPDFGDKYYGHYIEKIKQSTPPEKLQEVLQQIQKEKELFSGPVAQFSVMFLTVFIIGIIVTVISTFVLKTSRPKLQLQ